jgi:hypothetical protein
MEENWEARQSYEPKPQKHNIALALVVAAVMFSYAGCYAMVTVLQKHDLMNPFPRGSDPRPRWFLITFTSLSLLFLSVFGLIKFFSRHKLDEDEFAVEEEPPMKRAVPPQPETVK